MKPKEDGEGAYRAMKLSLERANLSPSDIQLVNCHATSTPVGDKAELSAITNLFNSNPSLSLTANKGALGHCFASAGTIESIFTIQSLNTSLIPPTLNYENPISSIPHSNVKIDKNSQEREITHAVKNSFGFGGTNVAIVFSKYLQ